MSVWGLDTETSGLHPDDGAQVLLLAAATRMKDGRIHSWAYPSPHAYNEEWPPCDVEEWRRLCYFFAHPERQLVFHNAKFDLLHLHTSLRGLLQYDKGRLIQLAEKWTRNTVWDTMLTQKILEGEHAAGLKSVAERFWREARSEGYPRLVESWGRGPNPATQADEIDEWFIAHRQKTKRQYGDLPWNLISRYARQDVRLTIRLFEWQQEILEFERDPTLWRLIQRELEFAKTVLGMELRGIGFDADAARESETHLRTNMLELEKELPFRPTLPAAKDFFFGAGNVDGPESPVKLGLEPQSLTKSGAPALAERDVDTLAKADHPYARLFWRRQALASMIAKWYTPWPRLIGGDGRLRPAFNLTKVRSHRLSVERVQVQAIPHIRHFQELNLPEEVSLPRELFRARAGHRLWEVDLSQGEVRIAAAVAGCQAMREIVEKPGTDVHGETCKAIFEVDESDPQWKSNRDIAKRLTFGTIYGAGVRKLVDTVFLETGLAVPESRMREFVNRYKSVFPEFFWYSRSVQQFCEDHGYVVLISGKRRYFRFGEPLWEKSHTAFNAIIQGNLAETMRDVMLIVDRALPQCLLLQIHDSVVLEIPRRPAAGATDADWAFTAREIMINTYQQQFGIRFDAEADRWENKK